MYARASQISKRGNAKSLVNRQRAGSLKEVPKGFALEELRREVEPARIVDDQDLQDAWMVQPAADLHFALEQREQGWIAFVVEEALHRGRTSGRQVRRLEDRTHPPVADAFGDLESDRRGFLPLEAQSPYGVPQSSA